MQAVEAFPDPLFVGEFDYISSTAQSFFIGINLNGYFSQPLEIGYAGLSVPGKSEARFGQTYTLNGYFSSAFFISSSIDTGIFSLHYGLAALITFANRNQGDLNGNIISSGTAIDTRLSQSYPTFGVTLFPKAPIRFHFHFLDSDANLLYGWLRMQVEFEIKNQIFSPAFEFLNHASFGRGLPNFAKPPGAFFFGYTLKIENFQYKVRPGFVVNSTQGFQNSRVAFFDRLILETSSSFAF